MIVSRSISSICTPHPSPQDGCTGLYMAAQKGHLASVRLLLDARADVNRPGAVRFPPPLSLLAGMRLTSPPLPIPTQPRPPNRP